MTTPRPAAFVLGLGPNGYGIVRSLGPEGVPVVGVLGAGGKDFGRYSKYCSTRRLAPGLSDEQLCEKLIEWGGGMGAKPVLFASSDRYAMLLAEQQSMLSAHFSFHWMPPEVIAPIIDKSRIIQLCQEAGVLCPRTHIPREGENWQKRAEEFPFPCIVKPIRSFDIPFVGKTFVAGVRDDLLEFYRSYPDLIGKTIWQQIISGDDSEVYQCNLLITRSGEVGAVCGTQKMQQYPPGFGHMCLGRSRMVPHLRSQALRFLRFVDYRGFASLEFKREPSDGRFYFIEMNPRLPWYNALFRDSGVNMAHLCYQDLTHPGRLELKEGQPLEDVYWVNFHDSTRWLIDRRKRGHTTLSSWLRSNLKARSFAWWNRHDPGPFLGAVLHRCRALSRRIPGVGKRPMQPRRHTGVLSDPKQHSLTGDPR